MRSPQRFAVAPGRRPPDELEWIVPGEAWHAAGNEDPPSVLGEDLGILNPALGWYILHAWVWKPNPSGLFNNWNPDVDCS